MRTLPHLPSLRLALRGGLLSLAAVLLLTACGSKLTVDNLQKVKSGMSPDEVKAILGSPSETQSTGALGLSGTTYVYHGQSAEVTIVFLNDKVMTKEGKFQ